MIIVTARNNYLKKEWIIEMKPRNLGGQLADVCICQSTTIQFTCTTYLNYLQVAVKDQANKLLCLYFPTITLLRA